MKCIEPSELAAACRSARSWALFVDVDCSVIDDASRSSASVVPKGIVTALVALKAELGGALAILSERSVESLDRILAPAALDTWSDGHVRISGTLIEMDRSRSHLMRRARQHLEQLVTINPGCMIEEKGLGIVVRWDQARYLETVVLDHALELASELAGEICVRRRVFAAEIFPANSSKERAVDLFMRSGRYRGRTPIFVGDERSDELAFRRVRDLGGLAVHVGPSRSNAEVALKNVAEVGSWLTDWAIGLRRSEAIGSTWKPGLR